MSISPEELMTRLGVLTPLFSADEQGIIAAINDKDRGHVFAIDRESGNFRWRVENVSGWVIAPPLIWKDLYILGTSTVEMARQEKDEPYATVDWSRGGSIYAFEAENGRARFWDERTGVVRETPRVEGDVLIVEGEIRIGGFRNEEPWSSSAEVESRFALPSGQLIGRQARGDVRPEYFPGEPVPELWK